jgi:hypothetical protein
MGYALSIAPARASVLFEVNHQLESRMRETRSSGSEGEGAHALPTPIWTQIKWQHPVATAPGSVFMAPLHLQRFKVVNEPLPAIDMHSVFS